jgi:hypothetical protein
MPLSMHRFWLQYKKVPRGATVAVTLHEIRRLRKARPIWGANGRDSAYHFGLPFNPASGLDLCSCT